MPTSPELAAKYLKKAASKFETLSEQNPDLAQQMREEASVFRQVSDLLEKYPLQSVFEESDLLGRLEAGDFARRSQWLTDLWGRDTGDRIPFSQAIPWYQCDPDETAKWCNRLTEKNSSHQLVRLPDERILKSATFWICHPSFYGDDACLLHVAGPESDPRDAFFLEFTMRNQEGQRVLRPLPRKAEPIHSANREAPLLVDGCELDYLIFFMHFVIGDDGMFRLLQRQTLQYIREALKDGGKEAERASHELTAPKPLGATATGALRFEVSILYDGAIFIATMDVESNGNVVMKDDEPILERMEAFVDKSVSSV